MMNSHLIRILSTLVIVIFCEVVCKAVGSGHTARPEDIVESHCGTADLYTVVGKHRARRAAGSVEGGSRWNKTIITYRIANEARTLVAERVEALVAQAFAAWAPHCGLRFESAAPAAPRADVTISFHAGRHGTCVDDFDGPGHVLAHAFYPSEYGTYIHFDDDEIWGDQVEEPTSPKDKGIVFDFYATALHEIGHTLGLLHSEEDLAVMYPYSQASSLDENDIASLRKLYNISDITEITTKNNDYYLDTSFGDINEFVSFENTSTDHVVSDSSRTDSTVEMYYRCGKFRCIKHFATKYYSTTISSSETALDDVIYTDSTDIISSKESTLDDVIYTDSTYTSELPTDLLTTKDFTTEESSNSISSTETTSDYVISTDLTDTTELPTDLYSTKDFTTEESSKSISSTETTSDDVISTDLTDTTELPTDLYPAKDFTTEESSKSISSTETTSDDVISTDLTDTSQLPTDLYSTTLIATSLNNSTEKAVVRSKTASNISATSLFGLCGFFICFAVVAYFLRSKLIG